MDLSLEANSPLRNLPHAHPTTANSNPSNTSVILEPY
jgi:hypothetical protein